MCDNQDPPIIRCGWFAFVIGSLTLGVTNPYLITNYNLRSSPTYPKVEISLRTPAHPKTSGV